MSLIRWTNRNLPTWNSWVDNFFNNEGLLHSLGSESAVPAVNISETENQYELELAAPGMNKKDFNVEVENGNLCISSESETSEETEEKNFTRKEYSYNSFRRSFSLPENASDSEINAQYKDGVLHISIPKTEPSLPEKTKISVS